MVASLFRRVLLCPMGLCQTFQPQSDYNGMWGECSICHRRAGEVSRAELRGFAKVTGATEGAWRSPEVQTIAPSLDAVPDSLERPLIGYLSKTGYRILTEHPGWNTMLYRDPADLNPKGGVVEIEIRVVRMINDGSRP